MAIKINRILPGRLAGSGGEKAGGKGAARLEEAISCQQYYAITRTLVASCTLFHILLSHQNL